MDIRTLVRALGLQIEQKIREFEKESGVRIEGFKLKRDEHDNVESVKIKIDFVDE
jgi:hypothetical protein